MRQIYLKPKDSYSNQKYLMLSGKGERGLEDARGDKRGRGFGEEKNDDTYHILSEEAPFVHVPWGFSSSVFYD